MYRRTPCAVSEHKNMPAIVIQFEDLCRAHGRNSVAVLRQLDGLLRPATASKLERQLNILVPPELYEEFTSLGAPAPHMRQLLAEFVATTEPAPFDFVPTGLNTQQFNFRLDAALHDKLRWHGVRYQVRLGAAVRGLMCTAIAAGTPGALDLPD